MAKNLDIRAKELMGRMTPEIAEAPLEAAGGDFDSALSEVSSKLESLLTLAPKEHIAAIQTALDALKTIKSEGAEEKPEGEILPGVI